MVLLTVPQLTTLASFVSRHVDEIEVLFEQVLLVCYLQSGISYFIWANTVFNSLELSAQVS